MILEVRHVHSGEKVGVSHWLQSTPTPSVAIRRVIALLHWGATLLVLEGSFGLYRRFEVLSVSFRYVSFSYPFVPPLIFSWWNKLPWITSVFWYCGVVFRNALQIMFQAIHNRRKYWRTSRSDVKPKDRQNLRPCTPTTKPIEICFHNLEGLLSAR